MNSTIETGSTSSQLSKDEPPSSITFSDSGLEDSLIKTEKSSDEEHEHLTKDIKYFMDPNSRLNPLSGLLIYLRAMIDIIPVSLMETTELLFFTSGLIMVSQTGSNTESAIYGLLCSWVSLF